MRKIIKSSFDPDFSEFEDDEELVYIWKDGNENRVVAVHEQFLDIYIDNGWELYDPCC